MMAFPPQASNQKLARPFAKTASNARQNRNRPGDPATRSKLAKRTLLILLAGFIAAQTIASAQTIPFRDEGHEREELGVNGYTAPSVARIFQLLDGVKPLPFDQLKREFPGPLSAAREQKALIFGGLIADGFLIVEARKRDLVEDLGRVLMREARGLGVGESVMRHSASLTELGKHGNWEGVRTELIATQQDVEKAMIEFRDQKMANLISLGGWLRGLEIAAGAVETNFSDERARLLLQPDLADYFSDELTTLPPTLIHTPLFDKLRANVDLIDTVLEKASASGKLTPADIHTIRVQAHQADEAILHVDQAS
jgi:hypothetical protein